MSVLHRVKPWPEGYLLSLRVSRPDCVVTEFVPLSCRAACL